MARHSNKHIREAVSFALAEEIMKTYEFTLLVPEIDDAAADSIYGRCPDSSIGK